MFKALGRPVTMGATAAIASLALWLSCGGGSKAKAIDERTVTPTTVTLSLVLGAGTPHETLVKIPPGATEGGKSVQIRLRSEVNFGQYGEASALEVGPADLVLSQPLRARRRVPVAAPRKRYALARVVEASGATSVSSTARRLYDESLAEGASVQSWEADVAAPGVYGLVLDTAGLGQDLGQGAILEDEVTFTPNEEAQTFVLGPPGDPRLLEVDPIESVISAALPPQRNPEGSLLVGTFAQTVSRARQPVTAQVVTPPPPPAPAPGSGPREVASPTVMRLRTAVAPTTPAPMRPGIRVSQPWEPIIVPPALKRAGTPVGPWVDPDPAIAVMRRGTPVAVFPPIRPAYTFVQPVDELWYGLFALDPQPGVDGGVPGGVDGGVPGNVDGGVSPDGGAPDTAVLTSSFRVQPAALVLTDSLKGQRSAAANLELHNAGNVATGTLQFMFVGGDAPRFSLTDSTCGTSLAPDARCKVSLAFTPTGPGEVKTNWRVQAEPGGMIDIPVSGTGLGTQLTLSSVKHDFGNVQVGESTGAAVFFLTNNGNLSTQSTVLDGAGPSGNEFNISDGCQGKDLEPGGRCTLEIIFNPKVVGPHWLRFFYRAGRDNAETQELRIDGNGIP